MRVPSFGLSRALHIRCQVHVNGTILRAEAFQLQLHQSRVQLPLRGHREEVLKPLSLEISLPNSAPSLLPARARHICRILLPLRGLWARASNPIPLTLSVDCGRPGHKSECRNESCLKTSRVSEIEMTYFRLFSAYNRDGSYAAQASYDSSIGTLEVVKSDGLEILHPPCHLMLKDCLEGAVQM